MKILHEHQPLPVHVVDDARLLHGQQLDPLLQDLLLLPVELLALPYPLRQHRHR